jgi:hypothetical protein
MKIRIVSSKGEISTLNLNERLVHLAFRASNVDFLNLMKRCPMVRAIQIPKSYIKTLSEAIQGFLEMQGIELLEGDVWGHRKDLDEYFVVDDATMEEIRALAASGADASQVAEDIKRKAKLSPDLVKYISGSKASA